MSSKKDGELPDTCDIKKCCKRGSSRSSLDSKTLKSSTHKAVGGREKRSSSCGPQAKERQTKQKSEKGLKLPLWENLGPNPDVQELMHQYDEKYFWGILSKHNVTVVWSKRLKSTVATCTSEYPPSIKLSEALLKLRTGRDLVEILLHEMIHAYLQLSIEEHEDEKHGPNFCKHMKRIDSLAGTSLKIDHSFHKEVQLNQYEWQCDGKCQKSVKHCYNKPPATTDSWWEDHKVTCGGNFVMKSSPIFLKEADQKRKVRSPLANVGNITSNANTEQ